MHLRAGFLLLVTSFRYIGAKSIPNSGGLCHHPRMRSLLLLAFALSTQNSVTMTGHTREVSSVAISPNGKLIASGSVDLTVRVWDTATRQNVATLEGHDGDIHSLAFSPDGKLLASGEMYKKLKIWDVASAKETHMYTDIEGNVMGLAFSPDGKRIFAACKDNMARVWTIGSPADAKKLPHRWGVMGIAVSPDGKTVATIDDGGSVNLWDAATMKPGKTMKHADTGRAIAFSPDGKSLASGGGEKVKIWDVASGAEKASAKAEANTVAFTPDGTSLFVGTQDSLVMCLNVADLGLKWKAEKHERPVTGIVVSPDGKTAYSSSMDYTLRAWTIK